MSIFIYTFTHVYGLHSLQFVCVSVFLSEFTNWKLKELARGMAEATPTHNQNQRWKWRWSAKSCCNDFRDIRAHLGWAGVAGRPDLSKGWENQQHSPLARQTRGWGQRASENCEREAGRTGLSVGSRKRTQGSTVLATRLWQQSAARCPPWLRPPPPTPSVVGGAVHRGVCWDDFSMCPFLFCVSYMIIFEGGAAVCLCFKG